MRYLILLTLLITLNGCIASSVTRFMSDAGNPRFAKARAIKKISKLQARQERLAERHNIGTRDTVIFRDTIITGGYKVDTLIKWRFDVDTVFSAPNEVIKWRIVRSKVDSIYVPYNVSIECPTDTTYIIEKIPCPDIKISRWERIYSKVLLTLRRWWWIAIIVTCIYLVARFWKNIKPYIPFI